jgi:hypothetical protein
MGFFSNKWFYTLCALIAFFLFAGDLVADAVHDATGGCVTESQSGGGHDSCPTCADCAIHMATALVDSVAIDILADDGAGAPVPEERAQWVVGLAAAIDHPPQLA